MVEPVGTEDIFIETGRVKRFYLIYLCHELYKSTIIEFCK